MDIEFWVIMDKSKKAIACGSPRNRSMRMVELLDTKKTRVLLYSTRNRAVAGYSDGLGFYDETWGTGKRDYKIPTYLRTTYPEFIRYDEICIPVKAKLVFDE